MQYSQTIFFKKELSNPSCHLERIKEKEIAAKAFVRRGRVGGNDVNNFKYSLLSPGPVGLCLG